MKSQGLRSSGGVYHDVIKFMCARVAVGLGYQTVEMEAKGEGKFIPDVAMRHYKGKIKRKPRAYVEVQDAITHTWMDKIDNNYNKKELIIIDVDDFKQTVEGKSTMFNVQCIYTQLLHRIADETTLPPPKKETALKHPLRAPDKPWTNCPDCGNPVKNVDKHLKYNCKRRVKR